jgi:Repeat of Unknown Function (DUF347)
MRLISCGALACLSATYRLARKNKSDLPVREEFFGRCATPHRTPQLPRWECRRPTDQRCGHSPGQPGRGANGKFGTAPGDCLSTSPGLGFQSAALVFGGLLALVALAYFFTHLSHTLLFWLAFVLTRPLGATLADSLTKPLAGGGLNLGRMESSLVIAVFIIVCILFTSQRSEQPQSPLAPVPKPIEAPRRRRTKKQSPKEG